MRRAVNDNLSHPNFYHVPINKHQPLFAKGPISGRHCPPPLLASHHFAATWGSPVRRRKWFTLANHSHRPRETLARRLQLKRGVSSLNLRVDPPLLLVRSREIPLLLHKLSLHPLRDLILCLNILLFHLNLRPTRLCSLRSPPKRLLCQLVLFLRKPKMVLSMPISIVFISNLENWRVRKRI